MINEDDLKISVLVRGRLFTFFRRSPKTLKIAIDVTRTYDARSLIPGFGRSSRERFSKYYCVRTDMSFKPEFDFPVD